MPLARIRYTVIAGERRKHKKVGDRDNARFVSGHYVPPAECGKAFRYASNSFASANVDRNGIHTLSEYLWNVEEGVGIALKYLDQWKSCKRALVERKPLGGLGIPLSFQGLSSSNAKLIATPLFSCGPKVTQGDMWEISATLEDLKQGTSPLELVRDGGNTANHKVLPCLLKISSEGAFSTWIPPRECGRARMKLKQRRVHLGSLLCFLECPVGMATVMEDLRPQGYVDLSPEHAVRNGVSVSQLWRALKDVLRQTLVPAANAGVVHADLRPGYDQTSNLLWCRRWSDDSLQLQLIDFDSALAAPSPSRIMTTRERWRVAKIR